MKKIGTINEHNFSKRKIAKLPIRKKVRALVFKDAKTLICIEENGYGVTNLLKLPGGSVEKRESNIRAIRREILEETGYEIRNPKCIGYIENIRKGYNIHIIYFIAQTKGRRHQLKLTQGELEAGTQPITLKVEMAKKRLKKEYGEARNDSSLRDILVLNKLEKKEIY